MKYAVQIVGAVKPRYSLVQVAGGLIIPLRIVRKTLEAVTEEAARLGITVEAVGDLYEIM